MSQQDKEQYGILQEIDDEIIYEIPKAETNLVETEQLEELKRNDRSFFNCQQYNVDGTLVRIHYKRDKPYRKISKFYNADKALKQTIATNLLSVEQLIGTQYTTLIHPDNIYVNNDGDVKFAHRGIRSVLPPEEMNAVQLIHEVKDIILYLFTSHEYREIKDSEHVDSSEPMVKNIQAATSIEQIRKSLQLVETPMNTKSKPPVQKPKKPVNEQVILSKEEKVKQPKKQAEPKQPKPGKQQKQVEPKKEAPKKKTSLLTGLLIGLIIGMLALYAVKVMPLTKETTAAEQENNKQQEMLTDENKTLQSDLDNNETIINAYHSALVGDVEEAINLFEKADELDENAHLALIEQYIELNSVESYIKLAKMSDAYKINAVDGLVGLDSKEANDAILDIESNEPEVKIEQAWINKEHEDVIEQYKSNADNKRAKLLAAKSYIELENTKESMKLGKELKNKDIQIASLEKDIELVKADKKMKKDKKKDKTKKLEKEIKKLKK